jgi:response regulator NasT
MIKNKRILIIEGDTLGTLLIKTKLEECGAVVDTASSEFDANVLIDNKTFDLVVQDLYLDDGFSLESFSKGLQIPFIVMSSQSDKETIEKATQLGAIAFIKKPLDLEKIVSTVLFAFESLNNRLNNFSYDHSLYKDVITLKYKYVVLGYLMHKESMTEEMAWSYIAKKATTNNMPEESYVIAFYNNIVSINNLI